MSVCLSLTFFFFFFFQAEDGIRDKLVTGVQTCALPISRSETGSHNTAAAEASQLGGELSPTSETTCVTPAAWSSRHRRCDGTAPIQQPDSTSVGRLPAHSFRTRNQVSHAARTGARRPSQPSRSRSTSTTTSASGTGAGRGGRLRRSGGGLVPEAREGAINRRTDERGRVGPRQPARRPRPPRPPE